MSKIRVHELAKQLGLSSKETIEKLASIGVEVKSHSSTVEEDVVAKIRGDKKAARPATPAAKAKTKEAAPGKTPKAEKASPPTVEKPAPPKQEVQAPKHEEKIPQVEAVPKPAPPPAEPVPSVEASKPAAAAIHVPRGVTVEAFAEKIGASPSEVIKTLLGLGEMKTITQSLSDDEVELLAHELRLNIEVISPEEEEREELLAHVEEEEEGDVSGRPPVVTVMGHVDHGKSSILQHFRKREMLALEAGGITQAIGAYQVHSNGRVVTFIDTPGHEAFTQMRARGAQITDIAVLVVAADDGVQPQTVEALDHARAAGVPVIVAVNKVDKPESDPVRVRQQLAELGLSPEEWGGDTVYVDVSAKNGTNMDQLLEMILLVADLQELKAKAEGSARGVAIEAHLDKGRGSVSTLIVQKGQLRVGHSIVCGTAWCKVRAMLDENGNALKEALPSQAVLVTGWSKVPSAGDEFRVVSDDREAKRIIQEREERVRRAELVAQKPPTLGDLLAKTRLGEIPELKLIIKADSQGSLEALAESVQKMDQSLVRTTILRRGVGAITENDVTLAQASGAIVIGFKVRPDAGARQLSEREGVDLRTYDVIYQMLDDIESATKGLLQPLTEETIIGAADVRATFRVPRTMAAGCFVTEGKITKNASVRLLREGAVVYTGKIGSLRRFKDDVNEVAAGLECGITIDGYSDVKEGDVIEAFEIREVART